MVNPYPPGGGQYPPIDPNQSGKKKSKKWPWVVGAVAVVAIGAAGANTASEVATGADTRSSPTSSATATTTTMSAAEFREQSEARAAAEERRRLAQEEARAQAAAEEAARLDPATYEQIGDRDFALLMRNPDAAAGRKLVVYGVVTQFDSGTGPDAFRANTAANPQGQSYNYDQNTMVTGAPDVLANVVAEDFVTMYVEVVGSLTYSTTMGGSTTVPKFQANIIEVTG